MSSRSRRRVWVALSESLRNYHYCQSALKKHCLRAVSPPSVYFDRSILRHLTQCIEGGAFCFHHRPMSEKGAGTTLFPCAEGELCRQQVREKEQKT